MCVETPKRTVRFVLPFALESLNVRDRKHIMQRTHDKGQMRLEIIAAIGGPRYLPRPPLARASVRIVRWGARLLDPDGLPATAKNLLDCLCIQSRIHPTGLGVLVDDDARHLVLDVQQRIIEDGETPHTSVLIEELPDLSPEPAKKRRRSKRQGARNDRPSSAALSASHRGWALGRR